ncbi:glycosyl transferase group 1 [Nitrosococcus halophilus Nc 4]|uniref:Glycosyl transferase group 1 n=1 Tax=Nitrosococcus halophilus (strain Nc4) TaxID=472759 RepID=D5BVG5_NITHN|nr:glycosyltransferase [Nitrosococcus halophilus]ADE13593.1 glycosyl transferase group 1 [Nitrosococcus halophilus Nc 4]
MRKITNKIRLYVIGAILNGKNKSLKKRISEVLRVLPPLRAAWLAELGHIFYPLSLLKKGCYGFSNIVMLRDRLADMAAFLNADNSHEARAFKLPRKPYNGKVLYALHSCGPFDPSGYVSRSVGLIGAVQSKGIDTTVAIRPGYPWDLAQHAERSKVSEVHYQGLRFRLSPESPVTRRHPESRYIKVYGERLQALAVENDVSIIHAASNYLNGWAAALAGRALGIPSVYEVRGLWHLSRAFANPDYADTEHYRYYEKREIGACAQVDHVITLSDGLRQWLMARGISGDKISVVGNAAFLPSVEKKDEASTALAVRRHYGIPADAQVMGYLGAIVEYEGLDILIRAHARTPLKHRPYLLIVGSGKHELVLRELVGSLETATQVVFAGRVSPDQVSAHYLAMDAVALPRRDDMLTRLVPAIKPFEIIAHHRPLLISHALATALGNTLPEGYRVIDFDSVDRLDLLVETNRDGRCPVKVPTWEERAAQLVDLYEQLADIGQRQSAPGDAPIKPPPGPLEPNPAP